MFITLEYLLLEAYSKPCQIYKMMRHIGNPCIVKIVYLHWHFQAYSDTRGYYGILRHIQESLRHIKLYLDIQKSV